jgi:membrane-bound lytic murein transglycosylase D
MAVQAATYSESPAVVPPTPVDENVAAEDDPDANLVPLDTEGPTTDAIGDLTTPTSSVPRAEDLLELNPAENAPATARFSDAFNPPAELAQTPNSSKSGTNQAESAIYNVPIVMDPSVQAHIHYFNTSIRGRFEQWLLRLSRYRPLVDTIFTEFQLPSDLVYLSLVESGFNPYAYSRAKATGPWQFMKGTERPMGSA